MDSYTGIETQKLIRIESNWEHKTFTLEVDLGSHNKTNPKIFETTLEAI